ncbi:hypothetical protein ACTMTF_14280 [Nonomuraea sp. ZG12]|uniref:hypothetical protein n=1 Tax=Nonomuraea sp. ZG12 TaxID=3452207 RepID=UPI003F89598D
MSWLGTEAEYRVLNGQEAAEHLDELTDLYTEVYSEPPYEWGPEHASLFRERFDVQRRQEGFALVTAGEHGHLVGFGFGVTLQPTTPWWRNLLAPLPDDLTTERSGRTWALVELLVGAVAATACSPDHPRHVARGQVRRTGHADGAAGGRACRGRVPHMGVETGWAEAEPFAGGACLCGDAEGVEHALNRR